MASPFYEGSETVIESGMMFQIDIIPSVPGYGGVSAEDGIAVADERLRKELEDIYPEVWKRIEKRRAYMEKELGICLKPEILPLYTEGYLRPFLLNRKKAFRKNKTGACFPFIAAERPERSGREGFWLGMGVAVNINMISLYPAADILCHINLTVNEKTASHGDNSWDRLPQFFWRQPWLRSWFVRPILRCISAGAVAGNTKRAQILYRRETPSGRPLSLSCFRNSGRENCPLFCLRL